ncbi:MAG: PadR family transcriptional regulator [Candidatus Marinimicrobia bacterium]|nr:PadR family transcriptional regulator [Candidatus Neomarinimicrobiota bacterium]
MNRVNNTKFAVLGVLALQPGSGYDVKKFLSESIGHFWKISYGQVYPLLKQLAGEGLATMSRETQATRPARNVYSITAQGLEALRLWLASPLEIRPKDEGREVLLRLFFGGFAPLEINISHVEQLRQWVGRGQTIYAEIEERLKRDKADNRHLSYWLMTLRMGQFNGEAMSKWCTETLATLMDLQKRSATDH